MGRQQTQQTQLWSADTAEETEKTFKGWPHRYTCSFAKTCSPVPTECQDNEARGIRIGTSEQTELIQPTDRLPRAQCPLLGHATYCSCYYALWHHCYHQDVCNVATMLQRASSPHLTNLPLLRASSTCGGHLLH